MKNEIVQLHNKTERIHDSIYLIRSNCERQIKTVTDPILKEELSLRIDSLWNVSDRNDIDKLKLDIDYFNANPTCVYCFDLILGEVARQPGKDFFEEFKLVYNNATEKIKKSEAGIKMANQLKFFKQSMIGSAAPNFQGKDILNEPISLNNFKGKKYILIDFWASFCAPCRQELPYIKDLYKKYAKEDFEIISISLDEDFLNWKNAIEKEDIQIWKHFSIAQNKSSVKKDYFVNGIPHKILIDKNGIIIGKWKASGELNKKSLQTQLKNIFGY